MNIENKENHNNSHLKNAFLVGLVERELNITLSPILLYLVNAIEFSLLYGFLLFVGSAIADYALNENPSTLAIFIDSAVLALKIIPLFLVFNFLLLALPQMLSKWTIQYPISTTIFFFVMSLSLLGFIGYILLGE